MKQVEAQIMGQSYLLGCPEGEEVQLRQAVQRVDEAMCKIRDAGKIRARERIAVLAALNLAFENQQKPAASDTNTPTAEANASEHAQTLAQPTASEATVLTQLIARMDQALGVDGQLL
ncbi:cell division protein ZapA [Curvibacter sp. CHRR-16]|uniref:cell division protein ZapA n=1 Tax=Curvibacter sp. CHRR-16 TaxID=2835872 RepID=UPI001BDAC9FF|nr:cell division protein ZapA [Curvibacter sp. CHRR-16]MBT0569211.1 cell division protein ZapA [Curvibacter sp. CHRR-16]